MARLAFTATQHKLLLPSDVRESINPWIKTQTSSSHRSQDQTAFSRLLDFWFMSIAWAVHRSLRPAEHASGKLFVNLGPNDSDIRVLEDWRADLLTILAAYEFGPDAPEVSDVRRIIDLANRYAQVGAPELLQLLQEHEDLAMPKLYIAADIFSGIMEDDLEGHASLVF